MKNMLLIVIFGVVALLAGVFVGKSQFKLSGASVEQQPLPVFSFPDVSGTQRTITEWNGKVLVINFWATWCPPCRKEIPEFVALQSQYGARGLQFVGIALDEKGAVEAFLQGSKVNYPMLLGGNEAIVLGEQLGNNVQAVPFTVIVNANGQIVYRQRGALSKEKIEEVVLPLILK
ncbi:hypothetical protein JCM14076_31400 [Methylosoma difficile]